ncbi:response regulator [Rubrolithibacter danxiaensis]|uniref:response regulator n=1 Tax=Rubrolithibacter danxiaensis TaxID=3390805 RepID=UPI003BF8D9A5
MGIACIVDDDPIQALIIERMLASQKLCKGLLVFKNGLEAIEHLKSIIDDINSVPDIILLDINMPVMNGWEFLEEFRRVKPRIGKKIILYMVSSSIWQEDIERAKGYSEVTDYIVKPVTMQELSRTIMQAELALAEN